jgi:hypothetical protein
VTRILYGLLGDLHVFVVRRYSLGGVDRFLGYGNSLGKLGTVNRRVNSGTSDRNVLLELRAVSGCVNGSTGDRDALLELRAVRRCINGSTSYTDLVSVDRRLDTSAVFAFNTVNGRVMGLVLTVNLNGRLGVGG